MINVEIAVMLILNIISLAFFAGIYIATIKFQGESIKELKNTFGKHLEDIKIYFDGKVKDVKDNFKEHLYRVECKQDKHNGLIERMVNVESSTKSAHHRLDSFEERFNK